MADGRGKWKRTPAHLKLRSEIASRVLKQRWVTHYRSMLRIVRRSNQNPIRRKRISDSHKRNGHSQRKPSRGARILKRLLGRGWKLEYRVGGFGKRHWPIAVDVAHPKMKLAIEVDGETHNRPQQKVRDRKRDHDLRSIGWSVFRVSEIGCRNLAKKKGK